MGGSSPTRMTRRRVLGGMGGVAASAFAASLLPPNVRRALAQEPTLGPESMREIKHVVLMMQENRSFDHYFGTMAGVRGFGDHDAMTMPNGRSVFYQPDAGNPRGYLLPFHLDTRTSNAQRIPSTNHSWEAQHASWNHGRMDRWVSEHRKVDGAKGPYVMGYYQRADIPFQFALAEAFTVCDAYHCSVLGPTWPNRMYWQLGTMNPEGDQPSPSSVAHILANQPAPGAGYTWTTYPERLERAGISWKVYATDPLWNMLENFSAYRTAAPGTPLHDRGFVASRVGQFEYDAVNDRLPAVSWIMTTGLQSEHPDHLPAAGAAFVASKIDAIAANPEVWAKTVFILNYDENDGMFDHVVPPSPPPGTRHEFLNGEPIGAGLRVPCILVSPWTAGGWVCSEPFDHTSTLRLLEKFTGVREPNISDWRRKTFGDLTSAFRFGDAKADPPILPDTSGQLSLARHEAATLPNPPIPGADQAEPAQEKGQRKRVPVQRS